LFGQALKPLNGALVGDQRPAAKARHADFSAPDRLPNPGRLSPRGICRSLLPNRTVSARYRKMLVNDMVSLLHFARLTASRRKAPRPIKAEGLFWGATRVVLAAKAPGSQIKACMGLFLPQLATRAVLQNDI
jgi:hypothetical protein